MANEITSSVSLNVTKGNISFTKQTTNKITLTASVYAQSVASIPTTAAGTAVGIGTVTAANVSVFKNLDASNYLELGVQVGGTFYPLVKLLAGESYQFRLAVNTLFARANTAAVLLEATIFDL